jgi:hypothetical protein
MNAYVAFGTLALLIVLAQNCRLSAQQRALEEEIFRLRRQLGLMREAGSEPSESVKQLATSKAGYIEALRMYRRETGSELKLSKSVVDRLRIVQGEA